MTRSIIFAGLLVAACAACTQRPQDAAAAPGPNAGESAANTTSLAGGVTPSGFLPYCGPVWSVDRQGYVTIPCP
jgi:hypothetical protein